MDFSEKTFYWPDLAFGIYQLRSFPDADELSEVILTFETNVDLAVDCGSNGDFMIFTKDNKLGNSSWYSSAGPGFGIRIGKSDYCF